MARCPHCGCDLANHPPVERRRPRIAAVGAAAALLSVIVAALIWALVPRPSASPAVDRPLRAEWTALGPSKAPPWGASGEVDSVVGFRGQLLAAGSYLPGSASLVDPAVWVSQDGASWTLSWTSPAERAIGTVATLVASQTAVVLFDSGLQGTVAWLSHDGIDWSTVALPPGVGNISGAVSSHGRWLAIDGHRAWLSVDGNKWADAAVPATGASTLTSVTSTATGLLIGGADAAGHPAVWSSTNGRSWVETPVEAASGTIQAVSAAGHTVVAVGQIGTKSGITSVLWWSRDTRSWTRAIEPPDNLGVAAQIAPTSAGFVLRFSDRPDLWSSGTGQIWQAVSQSQPPAGHGGPPFTLYPDGRGLLTFDYARCADALSCAARPVQIQPWRLVLEPAPGG